MICARCGLSEGHIVDFDTGSACHPELKDCIRHLKEKVKLLGIMLFEQGTILDGYIALERRMRKEAGE